MNIGWGSARKTILLVDEDAHARAILRRALEEAGFSVGEAATEDDAARTTHRIKPDAIVTELMMTSAHPHGMLSERLMQAGSLIPVYVLSTAAEAMAGSLPLKSLGISGIFLKPVDAPLVIQALRTRLAMADTTGPGGHADA